MIACRIFLVNIPGRVQKNPIPVKWGWESDTGLTGICVLPINDGGRYPDTAWWI